MSQSNKTPEELLKGAEAVESTATENASPDNHPSLDALMLAEEDAKDARRDAQ